MEKIIKDQEEFEKEHQFMQVYHRTALFLVAVCWLSFVSAVLRISFRDSQCEAGPPSGF